MISREDIETIVNRAFEGEDVVIHDCNETAYSKDKIGFLGDHRNLTIAVKRRDDDTTLTRRFFVKALPRVSESQSKFIRDSRVFDQEAIFFNELLPELRLNYRGEDWCPRCMLANNEILVLEDMRDRGYSMLDDKIFEGEHLKSALRAQARMHAASLLAETRIGKPINELYPNACTEVIYNERLLRNGRVDVYADLSERIAKRLGRDHRRIRTAYYRGFRRIQKAGDYRSKLKRVVCHGDTWPNNSLFDNGKPPKCVLVDFQLIRYAPRMYDVAQLIYLSTTREIRKRDEDNAIEAYHREFNEILAQNESTLERVSLNDLCEEYEDVRLSALLAAAIYYPLICMSKRSVAVYDDKPDELYKKIMLRNDNDLIMEMYDEDREYADRLSELVNEVVDYCEKLNIPMEVEDN